MAARFIRKSVIAASAATVVLWAAWPGSVLAQTYSGPARAVDGDTLQMTGARIRLFGIDAPEKAQTCTRNGKSWPCGEEATAHMASWIAGKTVDCLQQDRDNYGRVVAICNVDGVDLSERLARNGLAIALPHFTDRYVAAAQAARNAHFGIWAGTFDQPYEYRAAHPREDEAVHHTVSAHTPARTSSASVSSRPLYFRSCNEARAAGYSMMRRGQPGYRIGLDGDGDGIACEPVPVGRRHHRRYR